MTLQIRPRTPEDYPRLAELESHSWGEPVTADRLEEIEARRPKDLPYLALVAEEDGRIVGRAYSGFSLYKHELDMYAKVFVLSEYRRRGIGAALLRALEPFFMAHPHRQIVAMVEEGNPEGLHWAEQQGFRQSHLLFPSKLDLTRFDDTPFREQVERVKASGIRFVTYPSLQSPAAERKFFDLFNAFCLDTPDAPDVRLMDYEQWRSWAFAPTSYWPEGWLIALDESGEWAGLTMMERRQPGRAHILLTGVIQSFRGRGISLAMKVVALQHARESGVTELTTLNHSANAPMLAVNRKLGYVPSPGVYRLVKEA